MGEDQQSEKIRQNHSTKARAKVGPAASDLSSPVAISVQNVDKYYGRTQVLSSVSMTVERGSICGVIGRNGSGKTVLFRIICGLAAATTGEVYVDGVRVGREADVPPNVGCIIETPGFLSQFSAYRNLKLLADIKGDIKKPQILDAIALVGLDPKSKKPVGKYSLGMRQRLGIAQAIMENQQILVLDEPMNGLDNGSVTDMRRLFLSLKEQGKTILISSHNHEDIDVLCDKVYEMDRGVLTQKS